MDVEIDTLLHNGINESRYAAYDVTEGEKPSHETVYNRCADGPRFWRPWCSHFPLSPGAPSRPGSPSRPSAQSLFGNPSRPAERGGLYSISPMNLAIKPFLKVSLALQVLKIVSYCQEN
ncbi:unnamed protein product [Pocillopora meandrina]|uniref:Uncharacterized protein n=1 Tax=Pocillopora meandrina TaxID=46732 RepID=A0AAU9VWT4_9CNID|nr:unnamed protein product [Pocillopora meandrina]